MKNNPYNVSQTFVLVPVDWLEQMNEKMDKLLNREQEQKGPTLSEWISEEDAKQLLGKETTWLWSKRKNGELRTTKVGRKTYYSYVSILQLLENNRDKAA